MASIFPADTVTSWVAFDCATDQGGAWWVDASWRVTETETVDAMNISLAVFRAFCYGCKGWATGNGELWTGGQVGSRDQPIDTEYEGNQ